MSSGADSSSATRSEHVKLRLRRRGWRPRSPAHSSVRVLRFLRGAAYAVISLPVSPSRAATARAASMSLPSTIRSHRSSMSVRYGERETWARVTRSRSRTRSVSIRSPSRSILAQHRGLHQLLPDHLGGHDHRRRPFHPKSSTHPELAGRGDETSTPQRVRRGRARPSVSAGTGGREPIFARRVAARTPPLPRAAEAAGRGPAGHPPNGPLSFRYFNARGVWHLAIVNRTPASREPQKRARGSRVREVRRVRHTSAADPFNLRGGPPTGVPPRSRPGPPSGEWSAGQPTGRSARRIGGRLKFSKRCGRDDDAATATTRLVVAGHRRPREIGAAVSGGGGMLVP